jgi:hypothetical protein
MKLTVCNPSPTRHQFIDLTCVAAYMEFIFERLKHKNPDGSLQIMSVTRRVAVRGTWLIPFCGIQTGTPSTVAKDLEEIELNHLDGHKGSKPVRIGNGAADHLQLVPITY